MRFFKRSTSTLFILLLALSGFAEANGSRFFDQDVRPKASANKTLGELSISESDGLIFMREEEKLARDVYIYLFAEWGANVSDNIAESEQTHTDAILALLDKYDIADPVGNNAEGVFVNTYLQALYNALIINGSSSLVNALYVGAEIEEIDILDIQALVDALEGNDDVAAVYESLLKGSRNHLRAFVNNLAKQGVDYVPLHLSQDVYDAIIN
ncbi:MAG: DUF2202 domain-containing protein [Gammaproteobacteria bacterium]|nr:DUF2202 domain-containing protein [Gammaproteobacteria bacterium]